SWDTSDGHRFHLYASRWKEIWKHVQGGSDRFGAGPEVETEPAGRRFFVREICPQIDMRQEVQFEAVISRDCVAPLVAIGAFDVGEAILRNTKKDSPAIPIQKEQVPEGLHLAR